MWWMGSWLCRIESSVWWMGGWLCRIELGWLCRIELGVVDGWLAL